MRKASAYFLCALTRAASWCDKIVIRLDSDPLAPTARKPRIRESEIPRFRVSAGSLTLWEGISARAASWFELLPILYSYMAILEVISKIPRFLPIWDLGI